MVARALRRPLLSLVLAFTVVTSSSPAVADPEPDAIEAARHEFAEGTSHCQAKRWQEALRAFERSHSLVASPNTELMIARCLRELGRRADASVAYATAAAEAKQRVAKGEAKYAQTAEAATAEGAAVRSQLGTIRVHVSRPAGVTLTIDDKEVALSADGRAIVLHDPGVAAVAVKDESGAVQRQTVTVTAGANVEMEFTIQAPKPEPKEAAAKDRPVVHDEPAPAPPKPHSGSRTWAWPAAIGAGALTAAGLGTFIGFGLSSQATYDDLVERCGGVGQCGPEHRAEADSGEQAQMIANIGLGVAAVAAVATVVFVIVGLKSSDRARAWHVPTFGSNDRSPAPALSSGGFGLRFDAGPVMMIR